MGNWKTHSCMIISVSAGGKYEQKSLRDREGPHRSPGPLLNHFWMAVIHCALPCAPHGLFLHPVPGEYYNLTVLQHVCVCVCVLIKSISVFLNTDIDIEECVCVCSWLIMHISFTEHTLVSSLSRIHLHPQVSDPLRRICSDHSLCSHLLPNSH